MNSAAMSRFRTRAPGQLLGRLRRVGALFALFFTVLFASVHWIVEDIRAAVASRVGGAVLLEQVDAAAARLDGAMLIAAFSLIPVFGLAWSLATRYVSRNHLQELAESSFRKSQFVAMATAELRNPLNAISGFADLLVAGAYGAMPDGQRGAVEEVRRGAAGLKSLLVDIVDQANVEAGRITLARSEFAVGDVMEDAAHAVVALAERKGLKIMLTGPVHARVSADRLRMRQVTLNLLVNAIQASPAGSVVELLAQADGDQVRVTVADAGAGIPEHEIDRLFTEIRQIRSARAIREGLGLDLTVCRQLVELNGGKIWAENAPGAGARISYTLPAAGPRERAQGSSPVQA